MAPGHIAGLAKGLAAAAATGSKDLRVLSESVRRQRAAYCREHGCWRYHGVKHVPAGMGR